MKVICYETRNIAPIYKAKLFLPCMILHRASKSHSKILEVAIAKVPWHIIMGSIRRRRVAHFGIENSNRI